MSISDVHNSINRIEGRITEITQKLSNMNSNFQNDIILNKQENFKETLLNKVKEKKSIENTLKSFKKEIIPDTILIPAKSTNLIDKKMDILNRAQLTNIQNINKNLLISPKTSDNSMKSLKFDNLINKIAEKHHIDPELIHAMVKTESNYDPTALSSKGAQGLLQLMPETANDLGIKNLLDPKENLEGGTKYLRKLIDNFGDIEKALAAYNAGPKNVKKYDGIPPFKETKDYVKKVLNRYIALKNGDKLE